MMQIYQNKNKNNWDFSDVMNKNSQ